MEMGEKGKSEITGKRKGRWADTVVRMQGSDLKQGVAIYSSWAKFGPPLGFVHKVLLADSHTHLFT